MAANALKLKVPSPTGSQTADQLHTAREKALVKYLPDLMRFWAVPSISVRNGLQASNRRKPCVYAAYRVIWNAHPAGIERATIG